MPFGKSGEKLVFVGNKGATFIGAGLMGRGVAVRQNQQGQRLVFLTDQFDRRKPRPAPRDPLDIEPRSKLGKRGQDSFHESTMPAIEPLAGIGRVGKIRA